MIKAVIFDKDGTLHDTEQALWYWTTAKSLSGVLTRT